MDQVEFDRSCGESDGADGKNAPAQLLNMWETKCAVLLKVGQAIYLLFMSGVLYFSDVIYISEIS